MIGPRVPVIIEVNSKGKTNQFTITLPNTGSVTFIAYEPMTTYSSAELESYSGNYYSEELDAVYTLKTNEDRIHLFVKGNLIGEVQPIMKDVASVKSRQTFEFNETRDMFRLSMLGRVKNVKFVKR